MGAGIPAQQAPDGLATFDAVQLLGIQNGGLILFAFYNPFDVATDQQIGSNHDPTGNNTLGSVTVVFRGDWVQTTDIATCKG